MCDALSAKQTNLLAAATSVIDATLVSLHSVTAYQPVIG